MRSFATIVAIFATAGVVQTQELAPSDIENVKVNATATMAMRSRNAGREFSGQTLLQWTFEIGPQKEVKGRLVRTYSSGGRVHGKREQKFASKIDVPEKLPEGTAVWLLQKDELIRLITTNVGGWKLTINLSKATDGGWSCKATYERFQEVGKGHNRNFGVERGAQGQVIEVLSASQMRSSCEINRM